MLQLSPDVSVDLRAIVAAALIVGPWLFALVDAASRPLSGWWAAGHSKVLWVLGIVFLPLVGASGYLIVVRPDLKVAWSRTPARR